jgi:hypothetical protein
MALNVAELANSMLQASRGRLKKHWPIIKEYAAAETKKTAETLAMIERLRGAGQISPAEARLLLEMQRNSAKAVLLTVEGLGLLVAEAAINAAVNAVRTPVNKALGFELL